MVDTSKLNATEKHAWIVQKLEEAVDTLETAIEEMASGDIERMRDASDNLVPLGTRLNYIGTFEISELITLLKK